MLIHSTNSKNYLEEISLLSNKLKNIISKDTVFVCVGTDKIIYDAIGPIVGHYLKKRFPSLYIYGDLENPLTSLNIKTEIIKIKNKHQGKHILAIDAALTKDKNYIGCVELYDEPIKPGGGLNKTLGEIGDHKLIAIMDIYDNPDIFHRNVKLYNTILLSDLISDSIIKTLEEQEC